MWSCANYLGFGRNLLKAFFQYNTNSIRASPADPLKQTGTDYNRWFTVSMRKSSRTNLANRSDSKHFKVNLKRTMEISYPRDWRPDFRFSYMHNCLARGHSRFQRCLHRKGAAADLVTTQFWYPKIWAKFSLFALHCIMAYIFKLLN